ncbi:unnamed protein product [Linum tenue]|uniref:Uncharacterized protein n=1 Tax=Linum tenue TaxID=586396 RepID=A0AAV0L8L5_9ROSI|nr:unnamed protein product [Linum tenue]
MERVLKPYDKEYMRLAMLKHEETFRQQVYELHKLYRIQKLMMRSSGKPNKTMPHNHQIPSNNHQDFWKISSRINGFSFNSRNNIIDAPPPNQRHHDKLAMELDLERQAEEFAESNGRGGNHVEKQRNGTVIMEECEIELTLGPASFCPSRKKPCREEAALTSESGGGSLSSSSTGSSQINRRSNKDDRVDDPENGMMMMKKQKQSPVGIISSNNNVVKNNNNHNEQLRRQQQDHRLKQQQPPWLCQVLSLNMT